MGFAGDTFNTLWALRALTGRTGRSTTSRRSATIPFRATRSPSSSKHGIGIAHSPMIDGARPGLYAITLTGAERSFTYWRGDAAARQLAADPAALAKSLENQALVYFSGITLAILDRAGAQGTFDGGGQGARAGTHIAFDPNYRPRLWPDARGHRRPSSMRWQSPTSRCRPFPTSRRCSATRRREERRRASSMPVSARSS